MDSQELNQARLDKKLLSNVSKMPGYSISRDAWLCGVGSRLAEIEGSTCEKCYARKGMYHMPNVKAKMLEREAFFNAPDFVPRMVNVLNIVRSEWFRWFDSGDVADVGMALNILEVCRQTPNKRHWIPSREFKVWTRALQIDRLPDNAVLRMSPHGGRTTAQGMADHIDRAHRNQNPARQNLPGARARRKMRSVPRLLVR